MKIPLQYLCTTDDYFIIAGLEGSVHDLFYYSIALMPFSNLRIFFVVVVPNDEQAAHAY